MKKSFLISILCILFLGTAIKTVYGGVPNIDSVKAWKTEAKSLGVNLKDYTLIKEYKKVYDIASITKDSVKLYKSNASKLSINLSDYLTFCIALAPQGISSTGTSNYVPKFTNSDALENSIIYQNSSKLGIGTTTPTHKLSIEETTTTGGIFIKNLQSIGTTGTQIQNNIGNVAQFVLSGTSYTPYGAFKENTALVYSGSDIAIMADGGGNIIFATGAYPATEKLKLNSNGLLIYTSIPITDTGIGLPSKCIYSDTSGILHINP